MRSVLSDVVVLTPLGRGGRGGVDRLMDELRAHLRPGTDGIGRVHYLTTRGPYHVALSPLYVLVAAVRLGLLRLVNSVDVVHVNLGIRGSTYRKAVLVALARSLGVPYVLHLHGAEFHKFWDTASPSLDRTIRNLYLHSAAVVVLGSVWKDYIAQKIPEIAQNIVVIPNATSAPERFNPERTSTDPTIVFLGELGARKGIPQLVDALDAVCDLRWRAILAGNGDIAGTRKHVDKVGLSERVSVPGWLGEKDVRSLLANADILVLPSFDENLPMSIVEGFAHGAAVVATPVGAIPDIVKDGYTGLLVPSGDVKALANGLRKLLSDPVLRARLGAGARAFYDQKLEIGKFIQRLTEVWRKAAH